MAVMADQVRTILEIVYERDIILSELTAQSLRKIVPAADTIIFMTSHRGVASL